MHIAVLGNAESWYCKDLQRAAEGRGHRFERLDFEAIASRIGRTSSLWTDSGVLQDADAVIVRTMPPGSLEQVVFRMDALARLEASGVVVLNSPKSLECAVDKYLTTARLAAAGLPVPETIVCESAETALQAFHDLGGDVVVKPIFGAEGRGIMRVSDPDLAFRAFRTLERLDNVLYLQQFIAHPGYDTRIVVLDGQVLGGMRRHNSLDFRTNVSRNGKAVQCDVSAIEADFGLRAAEATGTQFAGVDLLTDQSGQLYVIEVNGVPGWRAFAHATGIDVAERVIASLETQLAVRTGTTLEPQI